MNLKKKGHGRSFVNLIQHINFKSYTPVYALHKAHSSGPDPSDLRVALVQVQVDPLWEHPEQSPALAVVVPGSGLVVAVGSDAAEEQSWQIVAQQAGHHWLAEPAAEQSPSTKNKLTGIAKGCVQKGHLSLLTWGKTGHLGLECGVAECLARDPRWPSASLPMKIFQIDKGKL